jgi:UDP-GlcNAc:undecaprenyl-phosphate GlcNAc-1-phosphate transferase
MAELAIVALLSFGVSLVLVPAFRTLALALGCTAKPRDDRWHSRPTALLGGVAIFATVNLAHMVVAGPSALPVLVTGVSLIFAVGLIDDLVSLKPYTKLVAELAIASLFVFFGYRLSWSQSLTLDTLLTMFWIIGLTNALNLLDNMDGLCAGIGLIAGASLLATIVLTGAVTPEATYLAALVGALAGFLVYNIHPASVFMGDSGSLFVGLNLAVLALGVPNGTQGRASVLSIIAGPMLVLLIPILDTTLVTVMRLGSGRGVAQGGRDHSSHRLVAMGLSERAAVAVLWALAGLGGLLALAVSGYRNDWASVAAAVFILGMIIFTVYLAHVRVYENVDDALLKSGRITPFVVEFMYRRRVAEVLLDFCLCSITYYTAYRLRFSGVDFASHFQTFLMSLPLVVGAQSLALFAVGGYRGVWRHFGLMDGVTFARGVVVGTLASAGLMLVVGQFESFSGAIFVIHSALLMLLLSGSRASFRLISEFVNRTHYTGQRLVIYGAGDVSATAVRDLLGTSSRGYRMLGFIDDDLTLARMRMQGYPVLGDFRSLVSLISNDAVDTVVVTTRLIDVTRLQELQQLCEQNQVSLLRVQFDLDQLVEVS